MNNECYHLIQPLCSSCITSLLCYYRLFRPSSWHRYSHSYDFSHLNFSLIIQATGSHSSVQTPKSDSRHLYAGCHLHSNQVSCRFFTED
ncbi:hypothetical protein, partial [Neochlamydia sp. AcF65]|uniref:hypothetical protein n=1 Tax=Neochlamydia sp. AcF65 TaxID=2795735 RepID=UPI001BC955CD